MLTTSNRLHKCEFDSIEGEKMLEGKEKNSRIESGKVFEEERQGAKAEEQPHLAYESHQLELLRAR